MIPVPSEPAPLVPLRAAPAPARSPALVYLAGLRASGRRTMAGALRRAARLLVGCETEPELVPWHLLRYEHLVGTRAVLTAAGHAPAYVNVHLSALRGVLRESWRLGWIDAGTYQQAKDVANATGSRLPAGRQLSAAELEALVAAADPREACLLALLYGAGLRRREAADVCREDLREEDGALWVRVVGKRGKEREVPLTGAWNSRARAWAATVPSGPLLGVSPGRIYELLLGLGQRAGVAPFTPHDLRRSMISWALERGADLATVARVAGHGDPRTTARYDRRGRDPLRRVADLLGGA